MVPKLINKKDLPKIQSWLQGVEQASLLLGPIISSFVILYTNATSLIAIAGSLFLIGFLNMFTMQLPAMPTSCKATKGGIALVKQIKRDFIKAATIIRFKPNLMLLIALSVSINLIIGMALATAAAMATGYFGASKAEFGLQQSFTGGLTLLTLLVLPFVVHRLSVFWIGIGAYAIICIAAVVIGVTSFFWIYMLAYAIIFASGVLFNVYIRTERALWIPKVHLGKTIGFIVFLNQLTLPVTGIIISLSDSESQTKAMFAIIGILSIGVILICFSKLKSTSKILSPTQRKVALEAV